MKINVEVLGLSRSGDKTLLMLRPLHGTDVWVNVEHIKGEPAKKLYPGKPYWAPIEIDDRRAKQLGWPPVAPA